MMCFSSILYSQLVDGFIFGVSFTLKYNIISGIVIFYAMLVLAMQVLAIENEEDKQYKGKINGKANMY